MILNSPIISGSLVVTGNLTTSGSISMSGSQVISGSLTVVTGSGIELQVTNTGVRIGNISADVHSVTGSLNVSGSITTPGTITAQTLFVQVVTSSTDFVTGSTRFGSRNTDTMQVTGSVSISGSATTALDVNAGALFVSSSGNVGIGTINPTNRLNVTGTGYIFNLSGGGTSRIAGAVNNTSGNLEWGLEGSAGNQLFTGASAYTACIGTSNNTNFNLCSNTNVRMTITSTGNVAIGTTTPQGGGGANDRNVSINAAAGAATFLTGLINNVKYSTIFTSATEFTLESNAAIPIYFKPNGNTVMTITGSNVGIGTTNPQSVLSVIGRGSITDSSQVPLTLNNTGQRYTQLDFHNNGVQKGSIWADNTDTSLNIYAVSGWSQAFHTNATERMRITSGGTLQMAVDGVIQVPFSSTTSVNNISGISMQSRFSATYLQSWNNAANAYIGLYLNNSFTTFSSLGTGTVYSNVGTLTNTNPSDERLKENIDNIDWGLNEILQLRPVKYNWKEDKANQGKQYGFIAQEVQSIMPDLVKEFTIPANAELGTEEVVRLGLEKDGIYTALVKAIQELKAEIDILKNK